MTPDLFTWLRGLNGPAGAQAFTASESRHVYNLWPHALNVIKELGRFPNCVFCNQAQGWGHNADCPAVAFLAAAEKERTDG